MPNLEQNKKYWDKVYNWKDGGEEWSANWGGSDMEWYGTLLPRLHSYLPVNTMLEIAPGFGRWTQYLKNYAKKIYLVDLSKTCIDHCRQRFKDEIHFEYFQNNGKSLAMIPSCSIDLVFSFDSLVHGEANVIKAYIKQLAQKLTPNGVGIIHHSNLDDLIERPTPEQSHWRAQSVGGSLFIEICRQNGLCPISQEIINWGGSFLLDCITVFTPNGSRFERDLIIRENPEFMAEAHRLKLMSELYKDFGKVSYESTDPENSVAKKNSQLIVHSLNQPTTSIKYEDQPATAINLKGEIAQAEQLIESKNYIEAEAILEKILSNFPPTTQIMNNLSIVKICQNKYNEAMKILKSIISIDPENKIANENIRNIQLKLNQTVESIKSDEQYESSINVLESEPVNQAAGDRHENPEDLSSESHTPIVSIDCTNVSSEPSEKAKKKVLIVGIYLSDERNNIDHIVKNLSCSSQVEVTQKWFAMGNRRSSSPKVAEVTVDIINYRKPKFQILNEVIANEQLSDYDYFMMIDDDISLPEKFIDRFIDLQSKLNFVIAQPARTSNSYIDHPIVEQQRGVIARETHFVEIGPVVSFHKSVYNLILPFDLRSPMGWGYELIWAYRIFRQGLKMGIIDSIPVEHSMRKPVAYYDWEKANKQRDELLKECDYLSLDKCYSVLNVITNEGNIRLDRLPDGFSKEPLISVLLPTYNRADLLVHCLESLTFQSLPADQFEVIVIDDGSTDTTRELCRSYSQKLTLRYLRIENSGISSAKNMAIFLARAPIVFFFDDDDIAGRDFLAEHVKAHKANPKNNIAVLGYTQWAPSLKVNETMKYVMDIGQFLFSYVNLENGQMLDFTYFWGGRSSCKRSLLVRHGIFNQDLRLYPEDIELGYRLSKFGLQVIFNKNAVQYMNRSLTFDQYCNRCERQGAAQVKFGLLHNDPIVQQYCQTADAQERWKSIEPLLQQAINRVHELEALLALQQESEVEQTLIQELWSLYNWAFNAFKTKGIVTAKKARKIFTSIFIPLEKGNFSRVDQVDRLVNGAKKHPHEIVVIVDETESDNLQQLNLFRESDARPNVIRKAPDCDFGFLINRSLSALKGDAAVIVYGSSALDEEWLNCMIEAIQDSGVGLEIGISKSTLNSIKQKTSVGQNDCLSILDSQERNICVFIKREVIREIGGLDDRFSSGNYQLFDYCLRTQVAGYKTIVVGDIFTESYMSNDSVKEKFGNISEADNNTKSFIEKWDASPREILSTNKQYKSRIIKYPINQDRFIENFERSLLHIKENDFARAVKTLEKSLEVYHECERRGYDQISYDDVLNLAGNTYLTNNDLQQARRLFQEELKLNPQSSRACMGLGNVFFAAGSFNEAKTLYEWGVINDRMNQFAVTSLANVNKELGLASNDNRVLASIVPVASIIILTHNNQTYIKECLQSLDKYTHDPFEAIIVDDASTDGTQKYLKQLANDRIEYKVILNTEELSYVDRCNQAVKMARAGNLIFWGQNAIPQENWLKYLLEIVENDMQVGIVGSKIIGADGKLIQAGGVVYADGSLDNFGYGDTWNRPKYNHIREVDYVSSSGILIRKAVWDELGGFDPDYHPGSYMDADLCFMVRKADYKVLYSPFSKIILFEGKNGENENSIEAKLERTFNQKKFCAKWVNELTQQYKHTNQNVIRGSWRSSGKRVLWFDYSFPLPDCSSGSLRMNNLMKIMVKLGHKVTYAALVGTDPNNYLVEMQKLGVESVSLQYENWRGEEVSKKEIIIDNILDALEIEAKDYEVVWFSFYYVARLFIDKIRKRLPNAIFYADSVNIHYLREKREAELSKDKEKHQRAKQTKLDELNLYSKADAVIVVTDQDREVLLKELPHKSVFIMPNVHDIVPLEHGFTARKDLLFVGGFYHKPNVDAMLYFYNDIFPWVKENIPDIKLWIVGSNPPDEIKALANESVTVTGWVKETKPYLDACRISIAPLRYGAGMKGKIGEALAHGLPVITTKIGSEGMGIQSGEHALLAESIEEWIEAIVRLYNDETLWNRLSQNGQSLMAERYSTEITSERMKQLLSYNSFEEVKAQAHSSIINSKQGIAKTVSIVILTYNNLEYTKKCVASIQKNTRQPYELIFVDNASKDNTVKYLKKIPDAKLILNRQNVGFPSGCNQGIKEATGEYIVLLNNDVIVPKDWLTGLIECAESDPTFGLVGPMTNNISGFQREMDFHIPAGQDFQQFAAAYRNKHKKEWQQVSRLAGFCLLIKKELIEKIGGLDPIFGIGNCEDDDYALRAALSSYRCAIAGDVIVDHFGGGSFLKDGLGAYSNTIKKNEDIFFGKWGITPEDWWRKQTYPLKQNELYIPIDGKINLKDKIKLTENYHIVGEDQLQN